MEEQRGRFADADCLQTLFLFSKHGTVASILRIPQYDLPFMTSEVEASASRIHRYISLWHTSRHRVRMLATRRT